MYALVAILLGIAILWALAYFRVPLLIATLLFAAGLGVYMTVAMARLTWKSWAFNDVSYGFIPVPLALPQAAMTLGLALLTIAILDVTIRAWRTRVFVEAGSEV